MLDVISSFEEKREKEQSLVCLDRLQNYEFNLSDLLGIVSVVTLGFSFPFFSLSLVLLWLNAQNGRDFRSF